VTIEVGCELGCERGWPGANRATLASTRATSMQVVAVSDITRRAHNPSGRGFEPHPPHGPAIRNSADVLSARGHTAEMFRATEVPDEEVPAAVWRAI
jgi:hypothetical protein